MNFPWFGRRNRFKPRSKTEKPERRLLKIFTEWRAHARRGALLALSLGALAALAWALDRPVRVISMDASFQRVSPGQIENAVAPFAGSGFLSADLDAIARAVKAVPWVDQVRVQRRWPNSLHVVVIEEVAAARWGESGLLNVRGELFARASAHVPAELPRLSGPEGTEADVARRYLAVQGRMQEAGMRIAALRLDERGAWELDLDSGVTVRLGRRDVDARLDRFIRTASPVLAHRLTEIAYVDMRYSNGFSIGWRNAPRAPSAPAARAGDSDA